MKISIKNIIEGILIGWISWILIQSSQVLWRVFVKNIDIISSIKTTLISIQNNQNKFIIISTLFGILGIFLEFFYLTEIKKQRTISNIKKESSSKGRIGILNKGVNNKYINNSFHGFDVGIQDEGKNTKAEKNNFY